MDDALSKDSEREASSVLLQYFRQIEIVFTSRLKFNFILQKRCGGISGSFPEVNTYYQDILKIRFESWESLNAQLAPEDLTRKDSVEDTHAHSHMINILGVYWH